MPQYTSPKPANVMSWFRRIPRVVLRLIWAMILYSVTSFAAKASIDSCDRAITRAAHQTGVPLGVLHAIATTESGLNRNGVLAAWPWTVNIEGRGEWFDTAASAKQFALHHYMNGARSFDVGCFQINYKWHHQHFGSLDDMFEPNQNALYAASFLRELFDEFGNWEDAAGAYHSRTPALAQSYKEKFANNLANYTGNQPNSALQKTRPTHGSERALPLTLALRVNTYPLLKRDGVAASMGSLVPLQKPLGNSLFVTDLAQEEQS